MKKFGVLFNRRLKDAKKTAYEIAAHISSKGFSVYIESFSGKKGKYLKVVSQKNIIAKSDMIFAIGGDGTLLKVAREVGTKKIPILGINAGSLGFLTELRKSDAVAAVDHILNRKFEIVKRQRLKIDIMQKKKIARSFLALNDVVIQNGEIARVIHINISIGNEYLTDFLADGVIASTPTGSTAYSLSAGGPIIFPENSSYIITPICPHTLSNRPIVIPDKKVVKLYAMEGEVPLVTIDGQIKYSLKSSQYVRVSKSNSPVYFLKTSEISYIQVLKEKLGWKGSCYL